MESFARGIDEMKRRKEDEILRQALLANVDQKKAKMTTNDTSEDDDDPERDAGYYVSLEKLNTDFIGWINSYAGKSMKYDFSPVCKEYINYMKELDDKFTKSSLPSKADRSQLFSGDAVDCGNLTPTPQLPPPPPTATKSLSEKLKDKSPIGPGFFANLGNATPTSSFFSSLATSSTTTTTSSMSTTTTSSMSTTIPTMAIVTPAVTNPAPPPSFLLSSMPLSQSAAATATVEPSVSSQPDADDDKYMPPEAEIVLVTEEDSLYSKKCKLFYKNKDSQWTNKGIGMLSIKLNDETKRYQFVVRGENALILLNINLQPNLPTLKNKNAVLLTCVPNPPIDPKKVDDKGTVTFLIRVKTETDAQELLDKVNECKM